MVAIHAAVLLYFITGDQILAVKLYAILVILIFANAFLSFQDAEKSRTSLPVCSKKNKLRIYNFYFSFVEGLKGEEEAQLAQILAVHHLYCR